jgi:hypothetical protein
MVTTNVERERIFTVRVSPPKNGFIAVRITNENGQYEVYSFNQTKLALFASINGPVRKAVDFLLGDANA